MASGPLARASRKSSRNSSPFPRNKNEHSMLGKSIAKEKVKTFMDQWVEPPLRPPAPSFEDYRGLERQGVLQEMAPLGSLPAVKARVKAKGEPHRRVLLVNEERWAANEKVVGTPEPPKSASPEPTGPNLEEEEDDEAQLPTLPLQLQVKQEREDADYVPAGQKTTSRQSRKATPAQMSSQAGSPHNPPIDWLALENVIDGVLVRAQELGNPKLGRAIKYFFQKNFGNESIARLLQSIYSQRPTQEEANRFQTYINNATKTLDMLEAKEQTRQAVRATGAQKSKYPSKSPSASMRHTASPLNIRNHNSKTQAISESRKSSKSTSPSKTVMVNGDLPTQNGTSIRAQSPAKALRKSTSMSSLSSLSSVDEDVVQKGPPKSFTSDAEEVVMQQPEHDKFPATDSVGERPVGGTITHSSLGPAWQNYLIAPASAQSSLKRSSAEAGLPVDERDGDLAAKRSKLARNFENVPVELSNIRDPLLDNSLPSAVANSLLEATQSEPLRNGISTLHVLRDETSGLTSPCSEAWAASSAMPSRKGTPKAINRPPQTAQRAARTKLSPIKKKKGVVTGLAPMAGGGDSPVGYDDNGESDNNDYCSACGGSGYLLCCDGCDRSFHFTCLDPPLDQNASLDEPWFCAICVAKRESPIKPPRGLFAALRLQLEKCNPSAYSLPLEIREYYEGVRTGENGEYEDALTQKTRGRTGFDEVPDYQKLKDAKGNVVLCYKCGKSSLNRQAMIQCDLCQFYWHLDCLDPPLANPPSRGTGEKQRNQWMCPLHADHALRSVTLRSNNRTMRARRPKNAVIKDTALRRGFVNNGVIEIENESSDDEAFYEEENDMGTVYRLPERGIKLDFIDKVKHLRKQEAEATFKRNLARTKAVAASQALERDLDRRPFSERQVALNLAQFAQQNKNLNLSYDKVLNLYLQATAEAPAEVAAQMDEAEANAAKRTSNLSDGVPPSPPNSEQQAERMSENERRELLALQELIKRKLEAGTKSG